MNFNRRAKPTLMPLLSLIVLSAVIAVPGLVGSRLYAAGPQHRTAVVVKSGDTLWSIAERFTADDANTQDTVDQIVATNRLRGVALRPGERLTVLR